MKVSAYETSPVTCYTAAHRRRWDRQRAEFVHASYAKIHSAKRSPKRARGRQDSTEKRSCVIVGLYHDDAMSYGLSPTVTTAPFINEFCLRLGVCPSAPFIIKTHRHVAVCCTAVETTWYFRLTLWLWQSGVELYYYCYFDCSSVSHCS